MYTDKKSRSRVAIFCYLINKTSDTIMLDRKNFAIESKTLDYVLQPFKIMENYKLLTKSDTMLIAPGDSIDHVFSYSPKNKIPKKMIPSVIMTDSLSFVYHQDDSKIRLYMLIGIPESKHYVF